MVFASAYRTSVLFTYDTSDPSYTLAPTVGWTAIEMSAGIVSACLPTMLPLINHVMGLCGLRTNDTTLSRSGDASNMGIRQSRRTTNNRSSTNFERLSDELDGQGKEATPSSISESDLRPDAPKDSYRYAVHTVTGHDRDESGDDIPLRGIRVQTAIEHSAAKM